MTPGTHRGAGLFKNLKENEEPLTMNLHPLSFEHLLRVSASLENPAEIKDMVDSLELLEKNIRYMRQRLNGKLRQVDQQAEEARQKERKRRKQTLKILKREKDETP